MTYPIPEKYLGDILLKKCTISSAVLENKMELW